MISFVGVAVLLFGGLGVGFTPDPQEIEAMVAADNADLRRLTLRGAETAGRGSAMHLP